MNLRYTLYLMKLLGTFTVRFFFDGNYDLLLEVSVEYGKSVNQPTTALKDKSDQFVYLFSLWWFGGI